MSGGEFNYAYYRIEELAIALGWRIAQNTEVQEVGGWTPNFSEETLKRLEFCRQIFYLASDLAHEVEWLYSGDTGEEGLQKVLDDSVISLYALLNGWIDREEEETK